METSPPATRSQVLRPATSKAAAAGKGNLVDALSFVADCLRESVDWAFKNRGGIGAVRRKSTGHPTHITVRFGIELGNDTHADYGFEVAARPSGRFEIAREHCAVHEVMGTRHKFAVERGAFKKEIPGIRPQVASDRLALHAASATDEFRPVFDFLASMRFYSIVPAELRSLQKPDIGDFLERNGSNAAAVLRRIRNADGNGSQDYERICRLLGSAVAGIRSIGSRSYGQQETLEFKQDVGLKDPWTFEALNISDGTLRMLGILLAVYQPGNASVLAIEEPEATVHPAVADVIVQVLFDASTRRQVVVTSHSPDIIDHKRIDVANIRVVTTERNATIISPMSETNREIVREHLYSPGELLRSGELEPDRERARELDRRQAAGVTLLQRRHRRVVPGTLLPIVEGHSEVQAAGLLMRRLLVWLGAPPIDAAKPFRVKRQRVVRKGELERAIRAAERSRPNVAAVLILLDADDDDPRALGSELLERANGTTDIPTGVALANREFEAWLLGAKESLRGRRGIRPDAGAPDGPETIRDAKGRLSANMEGDRTYMPVDDMPALVQAFDLGAARDSCPSFGWPCDEVARLAAATR